MMRASPSIAKITKFNYPIKRSWYVFDIAGKPLGRVASKIATILIGKNKPAYSPDKDLGDYVVVTNASKVVLTGKKMDQKTYFKHTGYLGNYSQTPFKKIFPNKVDFIIKQAVLGMLPKNKLRSKMIKRLKVYPDDKYSVNVKDVEVLKW